MTPKIGIILFPGTNCELESIRACKRSHMQPEIFRWNEDRKKLKKYDGFIIPGGFCYEDRGRSGVIASKDPVMEALKNESLKGKPLIGICNGAQILVEKGLIPGIEIEQLEMALAWNERIRKGKILGVGFYNDWIYIKSNENKGRSAFNNFDSKTVMYIPVAHGEGRFTTGDKELLKNLIKNQQTLFRYCDKKGEISEEFPVNPNGALYNLAGVCNPNGNVLALMPHPERTLNGRPIFDSMEQYIKGGFKVPVIKPKKITSKIADRIENNKNNSDIIITVELIITDNEERTIENTVNKMGFKETKLKRKIHYSFKVKKGVNLKTIAEKLIQTGEIVNLNKEIPEVTIGNKTYSYNKESGLEEKINEKREGRLFLAVDQDNFSGKSIYSRLQHHIKNNEITAVTRGVMWILISKKTETAEKIIATHILHNPNSMKIVRI
jgi:phosphoribosylformylglycinamidine synthase subunit PurQ / glutaminase